MTYVDASLERLQHKSEGDQMKVIKEYSDEAERIKALRALKDDGYMSSIDVQRMALSNALIFHGDRKRLCEQLKDLANHSDEFECVELKSSGKSLCFFPFWQVARMLERIERRELEQRQHQIEEEEKFSPVK